MSTLNELEILTKQYAESRQALVDLVRQLEAETAAVKSRYMSAIRRGVAATGRRCDTLMRALAESRELFEQPKTRTFHGVKIGWVKSRGSLDWEDAARVVALIKKHFPDQVDMLITVKESPSKTALEKLPAADLKRLGVSVIQDIEQVCCRPMDGEFDRLIDALINTDEIREEVA